MHNYRSRGKFKIFRNPLGKMINFWLRAAINSPRDIFASSAKLHMNRSRFMLQSISRDSACCAPKKPHSSYVVTIRQKKMCHAGRTSKSPILIFIYIFLERGDVSNFFYLKY